MGRISERQRIELALIWACTLILLYVLVLAPHIAAQRTAAHAEQEAAETALARVEHYQRLLIEDPQTEEKLRVRQMHLADALPEEHGQGTFIHTAEYLARRNHVTVEGVAPQPMMLRDGLRIQPIELRVRGGYFDLLSFLHAVQEGERCVRFGAFTLTAEEQELYMVIRMDIAARAE